jgi:hypothetical protein
VEETTRQPELTPAAGLTAGERRIVDLSAQIMAAGPDEIAYQHVVLCHLGFPRSRTDVREFERRSGQAVLKLKAGEVYNGTELVPQPLPYGAIPRLVMIAAVTKAVQQKTREIELGRSMTESLRNLGLSDTGASHWRNVVKQQTALAALDMVLGYMVEGQARTLKAPPFDEITAWVHRNERQATLFPSRIVLSEKFFSSLDAHSVPLDPRGVASLSRYPLALDIYCWLAHRLYRVRGPQGDRVPWMALRQQFGVEIADQKNFKRLFRGALKRALLAYPKAQVRPWGSGITLLPSPPPVAPTQVVLPFRLDLDRKPR